MLVLTIKVTAVVLLVLDVARAQLAAGHNRERMLLKNAIALMKERDTLEQQQQQHYQPDTDDNFPPVDNMDLRPAIDTLLDLLEKMDLQRPRSHVTEKRNRNLIGTAAFCCNGPLTTKRPPLDKMDLSDDLNEANYDTSNRLRDILLGHYNVQDSSRYEVERRSNPDTDYLLMARRAIVGKRSSSIRSTGIYSGDTNPLGRSIGQGKRSPQRVG